MADWAQEQLNYLRLISCAWSEILTGTSDNFPSEAVDSTTVQKVETLSPKTSLEDAKLVRDMMDDWSLFPKVRNAEDRMILRSNLLKCSTVPSLYTFFENLKYLEPCLEILRGLLPSKDRRSVRQVLFASYFRPSELRVEYGVNDVRPHPSTSFERDREVGYQQLWLMAVRDSVNPKRDTSERPPASVAGCLKSQRLGALAVSLGFRSEAAERLAAQDAELALAAELVSRADVESVAAEAVTQQIANLLRGVQRPLTYSSRASLGGEEWLRRERRCGRPFGEDHDLDRPSLFLPIAYAPPNQSSRYVSTLYCKLEMCRGFFGTQNVR